MVGIIILNYMAYQETMDCVESIYRTYQDSFRIYIVDNASPNDSYGKLMVAYHGHKDIVLIPNTRNAGYSAGNNIGIRKALEDGCQYLLISNSDILYHEGAIGEMKRFLDTHPEAGMVGPKVMDDQGEVSPISRIFLKTTIREKLFATSRLRTLNYRNIHRDYYGLDKSFDETHRVYHLVGCCFMMKRELALKVTPFDENTFLYEEELILGIQVEKARYAAYNHPAAVVTHLNERSSKHIRSYALIHLVNSEIYYCKRYLGASKLEILPIYAIRIGLYLERCLKDEDYRKNLSKFLKESGKRFCSKDGLGS